MERRQVLAPDHDERVAVSLRQGRGVGVGGRNQFFNFCVNVGQRNQSWTFEDQRAQDLVQELE